MKKLQYSLFLKIHFIIITIQIKYIECKCGYNLNNQLAVIDTFVSYRFLQKYLKQVTLCHLTQDLQKEYQDQINDQERLNQITQQKMSHGELIISEMMKMNPSAQIIYFQVSKNKNEINEIYHNLLIDSLEMIISILNNNPKSIRYINLSLGSINKCNIIQQLITKISNQFNNVIISAAAGNNGPWKGSIQFPSLMPQVLSIGTSNISSSKGPSVYDLEYPIIKPDFIIDFTDQKEIQGSSIACAQFSSYLQKQNAFNLPKSMLMIALLQNTIIYEQYDMYELGFGVLNLTNNLKINQFLSFVYIFPSLIDLTQTNDYWNTIKQLSIDLSQDNINENQNHQIKFKVLFINIYSYYIQLKNINLQDNTKSCPINLIIQDIIFDEFTIQTDMRIIINEIYPKVTFKNNTIISCTFALDFIVKEAFTRKVIKQSETCYFQVRVKAHHDKETPSINILLNQYYQLKWDDDQIFKSNFQADHYKNAYDTLGKSLLTNYSSLKRYFQIKQQTTSNCTIQVLETHWSFFQLPQLNQTLIMIIDNEKSLSQPDIEYLQDHLKNENNGIVIFGEWFITPKNEGDDQLNAAFEYISINKLLKNYGVKFQEGSFSQDICESEFNCIVYHSGSQIQIDSNFNQTLVKDMIYNQQYFKNDLDRNQQSNIIYYLEITTYNNSKIYLFGDSACLEESFEHKNCFSIIDRILNHMIRKTSNS